jgi:prophage regulatory protein
MTLKIYRIKEVCDITGLRPSSVYKQIRLGLFPSGIKLTHRSTGWSSEQLDDWLRAKVNAGTKS